MPGLEFDSHRLIFAEEVMVGQTLGFRFYRLVWVWEWWNSDFFAPLSRYSSSGSLIKRKKERKKQKPSFTQKHLFLGLLFLLSWRCTLNFALSFLQVPPSPVVLWAALGASPPLCPCRCRSPAGSSRPSQVGILLPSSAVWKNRLFLTRLGSGRMCGGRGDYRAPLRGSAPCRW